MQDNRQRKGNKIISSKKDIILSRSLVDNSETSNYVMNGGKKSDIHVISDESDEQSAELVKIENLKNKWKLYNDVIKRLDKEMILDISKKTTIFQILPFPEKRKLQNISQNIVTSSSSKGAEAETISTRHRNAHKKFCDGSSVEFIVSLSSDNSALQISNTTDNFERCLKNISNKYPEMTQAAKVLSWECSSNVSDVEDCRGFSEDNKINMKNVQNPNNRDSHETNSKNPTKTQSKTSVEKMKCCLNSKRNLNKSRVAKKDIVIPPVNTNSMKLNKNTELLTSNDSSSLKKKVISDLNNTSNKIEKVPTIIQLRAIYKKVPQEKMKTENLNKRFSFKNNDFKIANVGTTQKEEFYKYLGLETKSPTGKSEIANGVRNRRFVRLTRLQRGKISKLSNESNQGNKIEIKSIHKKNENNVIKTISKKNSVTNNLKFNCSAPVIKIICSQIFSSKNSGVLSPKDNTNSTELKSSKLENDTENAVICTKNSKKAYAQSSEESENNLNINSHIIVRHNYMNRLPSPLPVLSTPFSRYLKIMPDRKELNLKSLNEACGNITLNSKFIASVEENKSKLSQSKIAIVAKGFKQENESQKVISMSEMNIDNNETMLTNVDSIEVLESESSLQNHDNNETMLTNVDSIEVLESESSLQNHDNNDKEELGTSMDCAPHSNFVPTCAVLPRKNNDSEVDLNPNTSVLNVNNNVSKHCQGSKLRKSIKRKKSAKWNRQILRRKQLIKNLRKRYFKRTKNSTKKSKIIPKVNESEPFNTTSEQNNYETETLAVKETFSNPLSSKNGSVLHIYYEQNQLIVVQDILVSFWKYSRLDQMSKLKQEWLLLGERPRNLLDEEVKIKYKNRLCMSNTTPVYVEMRARQFEKDPSRLCNMASVYINVYYYSELKEAAFQHSVQLDNIKTLVSDIHYTTITNTRYFVMCWKHECELNEVITGLRKYSLTPDLDTLADITDFSLNYALYQIECFQDERLIGFGETHLSIWDHTGDTLLTFSIKMSLGENLGTIICYLESQNNLFLYHKSIDENEIPVLKVYVAEITDARPLLCFYYSYQLPPSFKNIKSSICTEDYLIATANSNEEFLLFPQNPHQLYFISDEYSEIHGKEIEQVQRFYSTGSKNFIECSQRELIVKSAHHYMLNFHEKYEQS